MALSIFATSILISGGGGYEVLDLRGSICEYVLQSIPISADHIFWDNLLLFNHTDTDRSQKIKQWLSSQCMHRYEELVFDHEFNYEQVLFGEIEMRKGLIQKVNKNLLVLDLDQSILFQKQTLDAYHSTVNIQEYNTKDLQFSRYFADPGPANLIIYRPFLMHMFMHNVMNSDFMIYAATCRDKVIFNILGLLHLLKMHRMLEHVSSVMECYYNFVWRLRRSANSNATTKALRFRTMITRMPTRMPKSIETIQRILDLREYCSVYIIDDLFANVVWSKSIPQFLLAAGVKFAAYNIPPFFRDYKQIHHKLLPPQIFNWTLRIRNEDRFLSQINKSKTYQCKGSDWRLFGNFGSYFDNPAKKKKL